MDLIHQRIEEAQAESFRSLRELDDKARTLAALLAERREEARLARLENPPRFLTVPPAAVTPEDLWPLMRDLFLRFPGPPPTFGGLRLRGVGRDEFRWEPVE